MDLTGRTFGDLTVTSFAGKDARGNRDWHCMCQCGNARRVRGDSLRRGDTMSCGCWRFGKRRPRIGGLAALPDFQVPDDPMQYQEAFA